MIPVLFVVVTLVFILTRMIPGNPATAVLGPQATTEDIAKMESDGTFDALPKKRNPR